MCCAGVNVSTSLFAGSWCGVKDKFVAIAESTVTEADGSDFEVSRAAGSSIGVELEVKSSSLAMMTTEAVEYPIMSAMNLKVNVQRIENPSGGITTLRFQA
jgi:hypothetical protein